MNNTTEMTGEEMAVKEMQEAFDILQGVPGSRENSLVITKLEEAMMWCNKDRTIKGQLSANPTHVHATEPAEDSIAVPTGDQGVSTPPAVPATE